MTIGIYSLYWEEQDLIYIGQSVNIERRFKTHLKNLGKNKHTNYKVQNAFNNFGIPILNILEECNITQLNDLEILWQKEFNSLNSLDLIEAGQVGFGINSNASKYTKLQILLAFRALYTNNNKTHKEISSTYKINKYLCGQIINGRTHLWLKEKYPNKYNKMLLYSTTIKLQNRNGYGRLNGIQKIKSPDGKIYEVYNIKKFCREQNFSNDSGIGRLLRNKISSYKGWTKSS